MKICVLILLLPLYAAAQSSVPAGTAAAPPASKAAQSTVDPQAANAQKARQLIDQAIKALGGQAYLNITDVAQEGRAYSFHHGETNDVGTLFWRFWKWPDKDRIELTKQRDVVYIVSGDQGYEITFRGTVPEDPRDLTETLRQREFSLEYVLRRWQNQPDIALFYDGQTVAENHQVDQITLMNGKDQVTLYLDILTHLPVKKTFSWRDETRYRNEEAEIYGDYRVVQGINTPFQIVREHNKEMTRQRFLSKVTYNSGIPDSQFEAKLTPKPAKK